MCRRVCLEGMSVTITRSCCESISVCVCVYVGLLQASVRGEEPAPARPLPALGRNGPRDLLHHLPAQHKLEPGPVPVPTSHQHVDCESGRGGGGSVNVRRPLLQGPELRQCWPFSFSRLLRFTFQPPFILLPTTPFTDLSLTPSCPYIPRPEGLLEASLTRGPL